MSTTVTVALLPYMRVHTSEATGLHHLRWEVSTPIAKAGFKPACLALGTDVSKAVAKVENDLLPRLRAFQAGSAAIMLPKMPVPGTVDELVHVYMTHPTSTFLTRCNEKTRKQMTRLLAAGTDHRLRSGEHEGMRIGSLMIEQLTAVEARALRIEYETVEEAGIDPDTGETVTVVRNRPRMAELVFEALKTAFNAARGIYPKTPANNPFEKQKFGTRFRKETYAADFYDLLNTLLAAEETGKRNMGTKCLVAYDLKIRVESIGTKLMVEHYKPPHRPDQMLITHWKTKRATWIDLRDLDGDPLYPALEERLDECKGERTTGILIPKDGTVDEPWGTAEGTLQSSFYASFRELMEAAGLPDECKFTSFRHGGITESAEAGCTENEMMILSGHLHSGTVQRYAKKTRRGREAARKKVLASRQELIDRMMHPANTRAKRLIAPAPALVKDVTGTEPSAR